MSDFASTLSLGAYELHELKAINKFLLAPSIYVHAADKVITESLLLEFNQETNQLELNQLLPNPINEQTNWHLGLDSAFVTDDGANLYLGYIQSHHYTYSSENSKWESSGTKSLHFPSGFLNFDNELFISKGHSDLYLLDVRDNNFYRAP